MTSIIDFLAGNPLFLLFLIIGVGYLLGSIRVFGFSLGVAAVLFVGIAAGALDPRLNLPEVIYLIGLVLFVYTIGLQSGPVFFASFRKRGLRINGLAVGVLLAAAVLAVVLWKVLKLSIPAVAGLYCGSLTNTPALAASVETLKSLAGQVKPNDLQAFINGPVVTYGLAYPFGVFGMIFWMFLFAKIFKIDFAKEEADRLRESGAGEILSWTFLVTNPALDGKTVREALGFFSPPGFVLSRILHDGKADLVTGDTPLRVGDKVVAVGDVKSLERARLLFGKRTEEFEEGLGSFVFQRIFVSRSSVIGRRIGDLDLQKKFGATITRMRRGDVQFVPSAETVLESGDGLRIMSKEENLEALKAFFGDSVKAMAESDFLSLSVGILLGDPGRDDPDPASATAPSSSSASPAGRSSFRWSSGKLERTGSIAWRIPFNANIALRQVGLVLFLAAIGTKAGQGLIETVQERRAMGHRGRGSDHDVRRRGRHPHRLQGFQAAPFGRDGHPLGHPDPAGVPGLRQPAGGERASERLVRHGLSGLDGGQDPPRPDPHLGPHPALIMLNLLLNAATVIFIYMVGLFILAQVLKNNSIVDIGWGFGLSRHRRGAVRPESCALPGEGPDDGPHRRLGPAARGPHPPAELGQAGGLPLRRHAEALGEPGPRQLVLFHLHASGRADARRVLFRHGVVQLASASSRRPGYRRSARLRDRIPLRGDRGRPAGSSYRRSREQGQAHDPGPLVDHPAPELFRRGDLVVGDLADRPLLARRLGRDHQPGRDHLPPSLRFRRPAPREEIRRPARLGIVQEAHAEILPLVPQIIRGTVYATPEFGDVILLPPFGDRESRPHRGGPITSPDLEFGNCVYCPPNY